VIGKCKLSSFFLVGILLAASAVSFAEGLGGISAEVDEQGKIVWVTFRGYVHRFILDMYESPLLDSDYYVTLVRINEDGSASGAGSFRLRGVMLVPGSDTSFVYRHKIGPVSHDQTNTIIATLSWCTLGVPQCKDYSTLGSCQYSYSIKETSQVPFIYFCDETYNPLPPEASLPLLGPLYIKVWSDFHPVSYYLKVGLIGSYASQDTVFVMLIPINRQEARFSLPSVRSLGKYGILNLADWGYLRAMIVDYGEVAAEDSIVTEPLWKK